MILKELPHQESSQLTGLTVLILLGTLQIYKWCQDKGILYRLDYSGIWNIRILEIFRFSWNYSCLWCRKRKKRLQSITINLAKMLGIDKTTEL